MQEGKIYRNDEPVIARAWRTENAFERMRGLLARKPLEFGEAFLIEPCGAIHTFGMTYSLDIVFVDREGLVVKLCPNIAASRFALAMHARATLELAAGGIRDIGLCVGDRLQWRMY